MKSPSIRTYFPMYNNVSDSIVSRWHTMNNRSAKLFSDLILCLYMWLFSKCPAKSQILTSYEKYHINCKPAHYPVFSNIQICALSKEVLDDTEQNHSARQIFWYEWLWQLPVLWNFLVNLLLFFNHYGILILKRGALQWELTWIRECRIYEPLWQ